ncbi:MAG: hypothetical protein ACQCXQ_12330 [Verrucomicrobiales bacterium]
MKRLLLYACIWSPGALSLVGFLVAMVTSRRVAAGELGYMDGLHVILPWVWIPGFLLLPAAILGLVLFCKMRWLALLQLGASAGLVIGWAFLADSGVILKQQPDIEQAVTGNRQ